MKLCPKSITADWNCQTGGCPSIGVQKRDRTTRPGLPLLLAFFQPVNPAAVPGQVELPVLIHTEGADAHLRVEQELRLPACARLQQPPDHAGTVVPVEIDAVP